MDYQRGDVYTRQVLVEIFMPRRHARETGRGRGAGRHVPTGLHSLFADAFAQQEIGVVEILEKLGEERVTVRGDGLLDALEDRAVYALRVVGRLQQKGRDRRDEDRLAHALRSVFADVARHFAAAHGETGQWRAL